MSFADWKKRSKRLASLLYRFSANGCKQDILEVCQAAYKAGERQGRKDAEALSELVRQSYEQERQSDAAIYQCPACGREYSGLLRCPRCGAPRV